MRGEHCSNRRASMGKRDLCMNTQITRRNFLAGALAGGVSLSHSYPTLAAVPTQTATPSMTVITDVTVLDATGAPPLPHMTVVIEGERIVEIRPSSAGDNPDGVFIVDGA